MAHLGARVTDLLDGRLGEREEERCWSHVHECHACRDLVEREGWVKTSLALLSMGPADAPESLKHHLREPAGILAAPRLTDPPRSRSRGLVFLGGSAVGAAVVGMLALGVGSPSRVDPRPAVTDLTRPVGPILTVTSPAAPVNGVAVDRREKMGP